MAVGHRGHRAENVGSSGALSSRTMMVTMTAKTASEYAASRCAVSSLTRIGFLGDGRKPAHGAAARLRAGLNVRAADYSRHRCDSDERQENHRWRVQDALASAAIDGPAPGTETALERRDDRRSDVNYSTSCQS